MGSLELKAKFLVSQFNKKSNIICNKLILKKMRMILWIWKRMLDASLLKERLQENINKNQMQRISKILSKRKMKIKLKIQLERTLEAHKREADKVWETNPS